MRSVGVGMTLILCTRRSAQLILRWLETMRRVGVRRVGMPLALGMASGEQQQQQPG